MPFDPRQLGGLIGGLGGNPAFLRGYSRAMQEIQQRKAQEQQMGLQQSQEDRAQQQLMLQAEQNRRANSAEERAGQDQLMQAVSSLRGLLEDPTIDDPSVYDQRQQFAMNIAPRLGVDAGFIQSLRPPITTFQKRAAVKKLAEIEKAYSPAQMAMFEADDATGAAPVFIVNGEKLTIAQLRERAETQATIDGKAMSMRPPAQTDRSAFTPKEITVNGRRVLANYDPDTGQYFAPGSKTPLAGDIQEYDKPTQGAQGSPQWVIGPDGRQHYRIPRAGDKQFDQVAARQRQDESTISQYAIEQANRTIQGIDDVLPDITGMTAGVGSMLSRFPGTPAANVRAELATVTGNIAFQALQAMREASKTGGALGNVSDTEVRLLSSVEGALAQDQSPANLRRQLQKIRDSMERFKRAAELQRQAQQGGIVIPNTGQDGWVDVGGGVRVREKK